MFAKIEEMAGWTRNIVGEDRLSWLRTLPSAQICQDFALVHASPGDCWRGPGAEAEDEELQDRYGPMERSTVVYGHIHHPYVRRIGQLTVANSGSVGLPHDGDRRASYLIIDDGEPRVRRVEYDFEREIAALRGCGLPYAQWVARTILKASPQMP